MLADFVYFKKGKGRRQAKNTGSGKEAVRTGKRFRQEKIRGGGFRGRL